MIKANYLNWIMPSKKHSSLSENCIRYIKAEQQYAMKPVEDEIIISLVNKYLSSLNIRSIDNPKVSPKPRKIRRFEYSEYQKKYNMTDKHDIVWIKFTKQKHHIGVIGTSCDINFDYKTTSGKIISHLKESWDESYVLIFPLVNIPDGLDRSDIESGIGNYLISKNVPILDFYSHNY